MFRAICDFKNCSLLQMLLHGDSLLVTRLYFVGLIIAWKICILFTSLC